jgi:hypothetical protein
MGPKRQSPVSGELFQQALTALINLEHPLLEQQKNNLAKNFDKEKDQYKKLKISFSQDIKDIFQKGIDNGRELLAESAFYQALITKESSPTIQLDPASAHKGFNSPIN